MSRLATHFSTLAARGERSLVGYVTVGDPTLDTSAQVIDTLCRAGVDVLELGVPFSDPTADGPTIQRASTRALASGTTLGAVLAQVRAVRATHATPIVLFGYYNPFLRYGLERLAAEAAAAGVDGFLVVDLPPEEAGPFRTALVAHGLDLIFLLTPTSTPERVAAIKAVASGFVYYVSRTGVTGAQTTDLGAVTEHVGRLKRELGLPVCVGFGVRSPEQVATLGAVADGVVVGSAIVEHVEQLGAGAGRLEDLGAYARSLKAPLSAGAPA